MDHSVQHPRRAPTALCVCRRAAGGGDREPSADVREQAQQEPALLLKGRARVLQAGLVQAPDPRPRARRPAPEVRLPRLQQGGGVPAPLPRDRGGRLQEPLDVGGLVVASSRVARYAQTASFRRNAAYPGVLLGIHEELNPSSSRDEIGPVRAAVNRRLAFDWKSKG